MRKFRHYRNKKLYEFVNTCKIQEHDCWLPAVIYREVGGDMLFVRILWDWENKFEEVDDEFR